MKDDIKVYSIKYQLKCIIKCKKDICILEIKKLKNSFNNSTCSFKALLTSSWIRKQSYPIHHTAEVFLESITSKLPIQPELILLI